MAGAAGIYTRKKMILNKNTSVHERQVIEVGYPDEDYSQWFTGDGEPNPKEADDPGTTPMTAEPVTTQGVENSSAVNPSPSTGQDTNNKIEELLKE